MEEKKENSYETKTNLLSCEDVVSYLWKKCDKFSFPFKPEKANRFDDKVTFKDQIDGVMIKKKYQMSLEDMRHMALKNHQEYDVDTMEFKTYDGEDNEISSGDLLIIYRPIEKFYYVFLHEENDHLKLLIKCVQKKKLFDSFPTETITFF